jgi:pimeloyl-ACP methyl ester carboxylesterase
MFSLGSGRWGDNSTPAVSNSFVFYFTGKPMRITLFMFSLISMTTNAQNLPSIADKVIEIDGLHIAYKDEGKGQAILCLHAVGHSSKDFLLLYTLPLEKYRIISIDFPSHGKSTIQEQTISATFFAKIVSSFIEKLELKNIILIGNSIGGATAIRVASNNLNIKMLSLSNPGGLDKRGILAPFFLNYMVHFFKKGAANKKSFQNQFSNYYKKVLTSDTANERKNEIIKDAYQLAPLLVQAWTSFKTKDEDLRPLIETVQCPVLFTWGMHDQFVQYRRNKKAIEKFKNFKLIQYKIGHTPYIECPEIFLNDLQEFIASNTQ